MAKKSRLLDPLPWYPWNPRQWQASRKVQRMTWAARGIYRELMDECWFKRVIPSTINGLAELLETEHEELAHAIPQFIRCFELLEDGTMFSPFIEAVRTEQDAFRLLQANRRKCRIKSGEPGTTTDNHGAPPCTTDNHGTVVKERREEERKEKVPPTPLQGERKRRTRGQIMEPYSEDVRFVANAVLKKGFWHSQDPDGRPINQDPAQLCIQLDLIFGDNPGISRDLLVKAAETYLAKPRKSYSAAQWFFGTGSKEKPAHWLVEYRMIQHQASRAPEPVAVSLVPVGD